MTTQQTSFAQRLRDATMGAHAHAESSPFFSDLLDGRLPVARYLSLLVQQQALYAALEAPADGMRTDSIVGAFVDDRLHRSPALARDVAAVAALAAARPPVSDATAAYVERLEQVATVPHRWLAHHYTRYLGDLSGGQQLRRAVERAYGVGTDVYRFSGLGAPARYKDAYRARLDGAAWTAEQRDEVVEEVLVAYRHNTALVRALPT